MEPCTGDRGCSICRRVTPENLLTDSQVHSSNASLLQYFLNCFHVSYLDTDVNDLSTSCQLCLTCEQFIAEWSSIQTQMNQLTRRNAQLKATLSALLLSEHEIQERIPNEDISNNINRRIHNAQEIELPLLLHQTVDDIRNELRRKYSARVLLNKMTHTQRSNQVDLEGPNNVVPLPEKDALSLSDSTQAPVHVVADKIQLPPIPKLEPLPNVTRTVDEAWDHWECEENIQLPLVPKIDPVSASYDNDDEPLDHSDFDADHSDMEYLPSENDNETSKRIPEMRPATENAANSNGSHLKDSNKTTKVQAGIRKTNRCGRKSKKHPVVIPVSHKKCKYNGFDVPLSELELENLKSLPAPQRHVTRTASDLHPSPPVDNLVEAPVGHLRVEDEVPRAIPVFPPPSPPVVNPRPLVTSTDGRPSSSLLAHRRLRKRVVPSSTPPPAVAHPPQDFESNDHEDPIGEEPEVAAAFEEQGPSDPQASSTGAQPDDDLAKKRALMRHTCPDCGKSMLRSQRNMHDLRLCQQTCEICGKKASRQAMPNHKCKEALKCTVTHKNPGVCKVYYKTASDLGGHIRETSGMCECGEYVRGRDKAKHVCGSKKKKQ